MIRIGVAGWDYPDWSGVVYPLDAGRRLDRLSYLSDFVDLVEINSSFYRPVEPRVAESWIRRTERHPDFRFTAKAHRSWSHERGPDLELDVRRTLHGLQPLLDAGRLGALLIQFPQSARFRPALRERADRLIELCRHWPVVIEVRHASWSADEASDWFSRRSVGWCVVDQPAAGPSTLGRLVRVTSPLAYLRLHGRNVANWFRPDAGRDARYDYLYSATELAPIAATARALADRSAQLFVVQNNHFRGQALVNALQLKRLLQHTIPAAPGPLVAAYPELAGQVATRERGLF